MGRLLAVMALMVAVQNAITVAEGRAASEISVWPAATFVSAGDTFELEIVANGDITGLMGFNVTVWYDSLLLQVEGVSEGDLLRDCGYETIFRWVNEGVETNVITANGAVLGHTLSGPGPLCTLTFRARALGVSGIQIIASDLRNGTNGSIGHTVENGLVYVDWTIPTERVTWGVVKSLYH
jgi:hypothetical protein